MGQPQRGARAPASHASVAAKRAEYQQVGHGTGVAFREDEGGGMKVRELMSRNVMAIAPTSPIPDDRTVIIATIGLVTASIRIGKDNRWEQTGKRRSER